LIPTPEASLALPLEKKMVFALRFCCAITLAIVAMPLLAITTTYRLKKDVPVMGCIDGVNASAISAAMRAPGSITEEALRKLVARGRCETIPNDAVLQLLYPETVGFAGSTAVEHHAFVRILGADRSGIPTNVHVMMEDIEEIPATKDTFPASCTTDEHLLFCQSPRALVATYRFSQMMMSSDTGGAPGNMQVIYSNKCSYVRAATHVTMFDSQRYSLKSGVATLAHVRFDTPQSHSEDAYALDGQYKGKVQVSYKDGWMARTPLSCRVGE
jgi:hypothetical protein